MSETYAAPSELGHLSAALARGVALRCAQRFAPGYYIPRLWRSRKKQFHNFNSLHFQLEFGIDLISALPN